jgi:hypothetical protein
MNIKRLLVVFVTAFAVTFIVTSVVTLLWNLEFSGASTIDWQTSFRFAIVFGIIISWIGTRRAGRNCGVASGQFGTPSEKTTCG